MIAQYYSIMADFKVVIAYPCTDASGILGQKCLSSLCDVDLFMPTKVDETLGIVTFQDMQILSALEDLEVKKTDNPDFSDPSIKVVFFPCIGK